jgi:hypothetical protein
MITNYNSIRATIADIKNKHLAVLQEKEQKESEETDKLHIRYDLARVGLVNLKKQLEVVFEDSNELSKLNLTITHRRNANDPDGIYHWNGNIYGTHHHYIDIRHNYGIGSCGTIRIYASCEPNLRVFYGVEIYDRANSNDYLNGILQDLCRSVEDEKTLSLITNSNNIVATHANVMGKLLATAEM